MRSLLTLPVSYLYKSQKLTLDQLALVETLSIGAHAVTRSGLQPGEEVLVVGAGPIGLSVLQFAKAAQAHVRILELAEERRRFAERFDVETLAEPDGRLADVVFDATGSAKAMQRSPAYVAHGGRLVFVGLVLGQVTIDDPLFHRREITLFASRNSVHEFPRIIEMIEQRRIDTTPWITHRMELDEVPARFPELSRQTDLVKAMIEVQN